MITELTKEQESKMRDYVEKWLKIGLSTENVSKEKINEIINNVYTHLLLMAKPKEVRIFEDPLKCWKAVSKYAFKKLENTVENTVWNTVKNTVWNTVRNTVGNTVRNTVENTVENTVWNTVRNTVENTVENTVRNTVENTVWNTVGNTVRNTVRNTVENTVGNTVGNTVENTGKLLLFIYPYLDGHFMSSYFSFYDYFINEKLIKLDSQTLKNWNIYKETSNLELIYPFDDICFVCQKPTLIKLQNNILHNELGPSISYNDNLKIYSLNGITVAEELVMTKVEDLDLKKWVLEEKNADVRREVVRKVGIERVLKELNAKVIDKSEDEIYELVLLDIHDTKRPYLKMKNPSIENLIHIEGVPIECDTIEKALAWRDGEDVYIKPDFIS